MTDNSFTYNGIDMAAEFKIKVIAYDLFLPPLRARKVMIPQRSGAYDYGATNHDERAMRMECEIVGQITDAQFDSLKYTLSRKGRIVLWDKPDRYFYGQLYEPVEVIDFPRHMFRDFELVFNCEPYAYALSPTILTSTEPIIWTEYEGTRKAPTRITIKNTGSTPMQGITITARELI